MPEVIGTFLSTERRSERANRPEETRTVRSATLRSNATSADTKAFPWHFRLPSSMPSDFVRWKVVHHHDIAAPECRNHALLHVGEEHYWWHARRANCGG
jgi:hypothetical protein